MNAVEPRFEYPVERTALGGLWVRGNVSDYCIEPIRFSLGFSRVQMCDDHLKGRSDPVWATSDDTDALLAARLQFQRDEESA